MRVPFISFFIICAKRHYNGNFELFYYVSLKTILLNVLRVQHFGGKDNFATFIEKIAQCRSHIIQSRLA